MKGLTSKQRLAKIKKALKLLKEVEDSYPEGHRSRQDLRNFKIGQVKHDIESAIYFKKEE